MPIRGETIGTAYVRILASGTGLDKSVRDQFDDVDMEEIGRKKGTEFNRGMEDALDNSKAPRTLEQSFRRGLGRMEGGKILADSGLIKGMLQEVRDQFGKVGDQIADELQDSLDKQEIDYSGLQRQLENIGPRVARTITQNVRDAERIVERMHAEQAKRLLEIDREYTEKSNTLSRSRRQVMIETIQTVERRQREADLLQRSALRAAAAGYLNLNRTIKAGRTDRAVLIKQIETLADEYQRLGIWNKQTTDDFEKMRRTAARLTPEFDKINNFWSGLSQRMALGEGSRNNFLNFMGKFLSLAPRVAGAATQMVESVFKFSNEFANSSNKGQMLLGVLGKFGSTAGGVVIAGGVIAGTLSILSSALIGVTALVTALISSLAFGLVGAIGAVAGALVPLGAGIGVAALAIANLSDKQKKALEPIGDSFKKLGKTAAEAFGPAITQNVGKISGLLDRLNPVVAAISRSMGKVLDGFLKDLDDPAWKELGNRFEKFLPGAVEQLGFSFGNAVKGMAGVFEALIPLTNEFLGWLAGITEEFGEWATSAEGQKKMKDFFEEAGKSAKILGDLIGNVGEAIGKLFAAGKGTGDRLFKSISDTVEDIVTWIDKNPEALQDFFDFGEDVGRQLGRLVENVIELIDAFDTPATRELVVEILDKINALLELITPAITKMSNFANEMRNVAKAVDAVDFSKIFGGGPKAVAKVLGAFAGLGGKIIKKVGKVVLSPLISVAGVAAKVLGAFPAHKTIMAKMGKAVLSGIVVTSGVIAKVLGAFPRNKSIMDKMGKAVLTGIVVTAGVTSKVLGAFPKAADILQHIGHVVIENIVDVFGVASKIYGAFPSAGDILNSIGNINVGSLVTGPARLLDHLGFAAGGVVIGPTRALIGESGPEAVVPLNRSLSMVDPAVRELSAIAQGLSTNKAAAGLVTREAPAVNLTIVTPTKDPFAVATETINRMTAVGY